MSELRRSSTGKRRAQADERHSGRLHADLLQHPAPPAQARHLGSAGPGVRLSEVQGEGRSEGAPGEDGGTEETPEPSEPRQRGRRQQAEQDKGERSLSDSLSDSLSVCLTACLSV